MAPPSLDGSRAKVQRAKEHFQDLVTKASAFGNLNPYGVVIEDDPETGERIWRARVSRPIPPEWSLVIGDVVHNLRASLDYAAFQLQSLNGQAVERSIPFPVWDRGRPAPTTRDKIRDLEATREAQKRAFGEAGYALIERLQPDSGRDGPVELHPLWLLNQLDIWDKHKLLVVVGGTVGHSGFIGGPGEDVHIEHLVIGGPQASVVPLADGAELKRLRLGSDTPNVQMNDQFTFFEAFPKEGPGQGKPVLETLDNLVSFVDKALTLFAALP